MPASRSRCEHKSRPHRCSARRRPSSSMEKSRHPTVFPGGTPGRATQLFRRHVLSKELIHLAGGPGWARPAGQDGLIVNTHGAHLRQISAKDRGSGWLCSASERPSRERSRKTSRCATIVRPSIDGLCRAAPDDTFATSLDGREEAAAVFASTRPSGRSWWTARKMATSLND